MIYWLSLNYQMHLMRFVTIICHFELTLSTVDFLFVDLLSTLMLVYILIHTENQLFVVLAVVGCVINTTYQFLHSCFKPVSFEGIIVQ